MSVAIKDAIELRPRVSGRILKVDVVGKLVVSISIDIGKNGLEFIRRAYQLAEHRRGRNIAVNRDRGGWGGLVRDARPAPTHKETVLVWRRGDRISSVAIVRGRHFAAAHAALQSRYPRLRCALQSRILAILKIPNLGIPVREGRGGLHLRRRKARAAAGCRARGCFRIPEAADYLGTLVPPVEATNVNSAFHAPCRIAV